MSDATTTNLDGLNDPLVQTTAAAAQEGTDTEEQQGLDLSGASALAGESPPASSTPTIVVRPIDGASTHAEHPDWGAVDQELLRLGPADFEDGIGEMVTDRPEAREVSNAIAAQSEDMPNEIGASDFLWAWGQFIDHDLDLTEAGNLEAAPIPVPLGDPWFDPSGQGDVEIPFTRVTPEEGSGIDSPRAYHNEITAYLDASMVYGSDPATAAALRGEGGLLLLDEAGLLPRTDEGDVLAGDVRAAENVALTSLHTLFAREHNRWVGELKEAHPELGDDELYHAARMRVEAEIQAITYNEFLPIIVGEGAIAAYEGYDPSVNPGISIEFSTAAFRFGHSLLSPTIERLEEDGATVAAGDLALRDAFFNPDQIADNGGIDPILRGLGSGVAQELDNLIVDDVRNFLFGPPGAGGLDLASLNIQRGRDLGVPSYNDLREALGLTRAEDFSDITTDTALAAQLALIYGDIGSVDAWVGGLAEDPFAGGMMGETFSLVLIDQFERVRDGDPLFSQAGHMEERDVEALWDTRLSDIIERNSDVGTMQDDAFFAYDRLGGDNGKNKLLGDADSDLLLGFAGRDKLNGKAGDDQLAGGSGNDNMKGGGGNDVLEGGDGRDTFAFTMKSGFDRVADFESGDRVVIKGAGKNFDLDQALTQEGDDVLLRLSAKSEVLFEEIDRDSLAADAFVFV